MRRTRAHEGGAGPSAPRSTYTCICISKKQQFVSAQRPLMRRSGAASGAARAPLWYVVGSSGTPGTVPTRMRRYTPARAYIPWGDDLRCSLCGSEPWGLVALHTPGRQSHREGRRCRTASCTLGTHRRVGSVRWAAFTKMSVVRATDLSAAWSTPRPAVDAMRRLSGLWRRHGLR